MIKNIIFDMGGVLIEWNPRRMIAAYGFSSEEAALLYKVIFADGLWGLTDDGTLTAEEAAARAREALPESLHAAATELFCAWWERFFCNIAGMGDLLRELKANGYRLYLLSNVSKTVYAYLSRIDGVACFDGVFISAEQGCAKPARRIYEGLLARFSLAAEQCHFIDDNAPNIEGARAVGIGGTVFSGDVAALRRALREVGVRVG